VAYYYYLGAQLPYLFYGQPVPMSSDAYRDLALASLNPEDARDFLYCTMEPLNEIELSEANVKSDFVKSWNNWEEVLRLNLARGRSQKLKRDSSELKEPPEVPTDAAEAAKAAMNMDSPLEAELLLDKARWDAIEVFQGLNYFSEKMMFAYFLKLKLMERRQVFNAEEGFTEYKNLYASILEKEKMENLVNTGEPK